jgi:hypothetical protein
MLSSTLEQINQSLFNEKEGVTAIIPTVRSGPELRPQAKIHKSSKPKTSSKKVPKTRIIRILLDSGSNGDLLFHEKGTAKSYPYLTRQAPKSWFTLNGEFQTKGKGSLGVIFLGNYP